MPNAPTRRRDFGLREIINNTWGRTDGTWCCGDYHSEIQISRAVRCCANGEAPRSNMLCGTMRIFPRCECVGVGNGRTMSSPISIVELLRSGDNPGFETLSVFMRVESPSALWAVLSSSNDASSDKFGPTWSPCLYRLLCTTIIQPRLEHLHSIESLVLLFHTL